MNRSLLSFFVAAGLLLSTLGVAAQEPVTTPTADPSTQQNAETPARVQPEAISYAAASPSARMQDTDRPPFHFGFKFSPTLAWLKTDSKGLERDGSKIGFSYGIVTEFNIQDNYSIATGLQVTYRGGNVRFRYANNPVYPEYSYKISMQYVELPVTLKMTTNEFGKVRYFGQFGFAPGLNIRAKADYSLEDKGLADPAAWSKDVDYEEDFSDYVNAFNLSMIIAGGVEYRISGSTVVFSSLEFNNGFIDVFGKVKQPYVPTPGNPTVDPRSVNWTAVTNHFALNIGILF